MKTRGGMEVTGFEEFRNRLNRALADHQAEAMRAIREIGDLGLLGAVEYAPIDEGLLAESIEKLVQEEGGIYVAVIRVPLNAPAADYAVAMHEDQYNPGPKSQKKAAKVGHEVGRKYIVKGIASQRERFLVVIKKRLGV